MDALFLGMGLGLLVAAQPGPVSLLLVRTIARGRRLAGFMIGVAAAVVDTVYASLGAAGVAPLLQWGPLRLALGLVGGGVLVFIGARTLWSAWRVRAGMETDEEVASPRRAFLTGLAATASNPLTIASWAAIFAAASVAGAANSASGAVLLVAGTGLGSVAWFAGLSLGAGAVVRRVGYRWVPVLDIGCGVGLVGFGAALGIRTAATAESWRASPRVLGRLNVALTTDFRPVRPRLPGAGAPQRCSGDSFAPHGQAVLPTP